MFFFPYFAFLLLFSVRNLLDLCYRCKIIDMVHIYPRETSAEDFSLLVILAKGPPQAWPRED
jgi:hypothetical protein